MGYMKELMNLSYIGAGGSDDESSIESDTSSDIEDSVTLINFCTSFYIICLYAFFVLNMYLYV